MPTRSQARAHCKFCGAVGVTEEHALGRQFHKVLPGAGWFVHRTWDPDRPFDGPLVKKTKRPAYTARIACKPCNGGWMARLDDDVVALVASMSRGRAVVLDHEARAALAAWASKVMLVMFAKEAPRRRFVPDDVYREVGATHQPPRAMTLWLGAVHSLDPLWFLPCDLHFRDASPGYGATLSVGRLLFHCVAQLRGPAPDLRLRGPAHRSLCRISPDPEERVLWPPRERLRRADLPYVSEGVANMSVLAPTV